MRCAPAEAPRRVLPCPGLRAVPHPGSPSAAPSRLRGRGPSLPAGADSRPGTALLRSESKRFGLDEKMRKPAAGGGEGRGGREKRGRSAGWGVHRALPAAAARAAPAVSSCAGNGLSTWRPEAGRPGGRRPGGWIIHETRIGRRPWSPPPAGAWSPPRGPGSPPGRARPPGAALTATRPDAQRPAVPSVRPSVRRGAGWVLGRGRTADAPQGEGAREESGERPGRCSRVHGPGARCLRAPCTQTGSWVRERGHKGRHGAKKLIHEL